MVRSAPVWNDKLPDEKGGTVPVNALAFKPDGTQLLVVGGPRVFLYDAETGDLKNSAKNHSGPVYCVAWDRTGTRFATGSADKTVVIWKENCTAIVSYPNETAVQCVAFNPVTLDLASGTSTELALCPPRVGADGTLNVPKKAVKSRILCCAWTNDGQNLVLGMFNGTISFRNRHGEEIATVQRSMPVWTLAWNPTGDDLYDVLAVGCWDQTLSFYSRVPEFQLLGERQLDFDPCTVSYFSNGAYLIVGGSDRRVTLWTKQATKLRDLAVASSWVWTAAQRPKGNFIALGSEDGVVGGYQLLFQTVHGLYLDKYAYRDGMTNVVVDQLGTEKRLVIPCRSYVRRVAVYHDRLAVQLPDATLVYELAREDRIVESRGELRARLLHRIEKAFECSLLVMTKAHLVLCWDHKLQLYNFVGVKVREWVLDAPVYYMKVVGGPPHKEALLVGLRNGDVLRIFIDNPFPIHLVNVGAAARCVDLSPLRTKIAVVDENKQCFVYSLGPPESHDDDSGTIGGVPKRTLMYTEPNASSVAWNTACDEQVCFSDSGYLHVKTGTFPRHTQRLFGYVVGFKASTLFCLHNNRTVTVDIPQSSTVYRYLEQKDFARAYQIACLGVSESDWRLLAIQALAAQKIRIARKAFIKVHDAHYTELVNRIEIEARHPTTTPDVIAAMIYAHQGKLTDAARMYKRAGMNQRAIQMYVDLKMWSPAQQLATSEDTKRELIREQARWAEEVGEWLEAAAAWAEAGDVMRSIVIYGDAGLVDNLIFLCRSLPKSDRDAIALCASYFRRRHAPIYAEEAYIKIGDTRSLVSLHVEFSQWEKALALADQYPEYIPDVYVPYAEHLLLSNQFDAAQAAYKKAKRPDEALRMLHQLAVNGVTMRRFDTAAFYFWRLAIEGLHVVADEEHEVDAARAIAKADAAKKAKKEKDREKDRDSAATADAEGTSDRKPRARLVEPAPTVSVASAGSPTTSGDARKELVTGAVVEVTGLSDGALVRCRQFLQHLQRAEWYFAYSRIQHYTELPVTDMDPLVLFHTCRYLLANFSAPNAPECPAGISRLQILLALARLCRELEAYGLARQVYERLHQYVLPRATQEDVDVQNMLLWAKPQADKDDTKPICYRCSVQNPLLHTKGDVCSNCGHPFVRSFHTFDHLPLIEFVLAKDFTHSEAEAVLNSGEMGIRGYRAKDADYLEEMGLHGDPDALAAAQTESRLAEDFAQGMIDSEVTERDPFQRQLLRLRYAHTSAEYKAVVVTKDMLLSMKRDEVFVVRWPTRAVPPTYYRNIFPEVVIYQCEECNHFFHEDDFEFEALKRGGCPFCKKAYVP